MVVSVLQVRAESDGGLLRQPFLDDHVQIRECTAADKENILGVHRGQRDHGVLAVRPHRDLNVTALQQLEHPLLYGLPAYIPLIRVLLLGNLVDLIYEDDPLLRLLHIVVCRRQKFRYDTLDIVSDISRFRKRGRVRDGKRNIQKPCQRPDQISLAGTRRPDHQHIRFLNLYLIHGIRRHTLIMVIDRHGHRLLRILLPHNILVKPSLDLMRRGNIPDINQGLSLLPLLLLLDLLLLRDILLHVGHIKDLYPRNVHIHQLTVINLPAHHGVKTLLHTITTDRDTVGEIDHLSRRRLRAPAHEADLLIFIFMILRLFHLSLSHTLYIILILILILFGHPQSLLSRTRRSHFLAARLLS